MELLCGAQASKGDQNIYKGRTKIFCAKISEYIYLIPAGKINPYYTIIFIVLGGTK